MGKMSKNQKKGEKNEEMKSTDFRYPIGQL